MENIKEMILVACLVFVPMYVIPLMAVLGD